MRALIDVKKQDDLVYDVGMHKAEDTEFYLRKGFRVIAFEADPDLARECKARLHSYIERGQLVLVEGAIIDLEDEGNWGRKKIQFYKNDAMSVLGTINTNWAERNDKLGSSSSGLIEVDVIDFSAVIQKYGMPHYMMIDIEGCDMVCVNTLKRFAARPDYISIESDKTGFSKIKHEIDTLFELGYSGFQAVEQNGIPDVQSPPQPAAEGNYAPHRFEIGSSGLFGAELEGAWRTREQILRRYRIIQLGYDLLGDAGVMNTWKFKGDWILRAIVRRTLQFFTRAIVPGWYDTHARHSSVRDSGMG
jgi:FkbM family methyltransferase